MIVRFNTDRFEVDNDQVRLLAEFVDIDPKVFHGVIVPLPATREMILAAAKAVGSEIRAKKLVKEAVSRDVMSSLFGADITIDEVIE